MESRVLLQPAYVLHSQPFQNTSLLVDFFTMDYGRVRAVAKGARREKSKYRSLVQAFHPLLVSFSGRGEVKTMGAVEAGHGAIIFQGERLFSGMYVNEILCRLLHNHEEHKVLYRNYQDTLIGLQGDSNMEVILRKFELNLLAELGYAINLEEDYLSQQPIAADSQYRFTPELGFEITDQDEEPEQNPRIFRGVHLIALRDFNFAEKESAKAAKRLLRIALGAHLGEKPLNSRALFR
ncbi:MAG: DNA repair protein RecO [Gammaproteobacteria bacterium]|nr:DNA repair protein RecO [Gammaproteobacteria bacterium]